MHTYQVPGRMGHRATPYGAGMTDVVAAQSSAPAPRPGPQAALDSFRVDGRVAIVTGASSGLGERFARVLHAAGATVVVAARRRERLESLVADLPGAIAVNGDVAHAADRERLVATTVERLDRKSVV